MKIIKIREHINESLNQVEGVYQCTLKNKEAEIIVRQGDEFYVLSFYGGVPNLVKAHKNVVKRFMENKNNTCNYCEKDRNDALHYNRWGGDYKAAFIKGDKIISVINYEDYDSFDNGISVKFKINLCPMCGKKLSE